MLPGGNSRFLPRRLQWTAIIRGGLKVFFRHLDVFEWQKERTKNILEIFWEGIVGTLAATFKNHPHDQLAADIPISGTFTNSHIGVFYAAGSLLHNAFIRSLVPKITRKETIEDVKQNRPAVPQPQQGTNATSATTTNENKDRLKSPLDQSQH